MISFKQLPMKHKSPPDMSNILKQVAKQSVITQVENVNRAIILQDKNRCSILKTDGINIVVSFEQQQNTLNCFYESSLFTGNV